MLLQVTDKWLRMAKIYRRFAIDFPQADFSEEAQQEMFAHESSGAPLTNNMNGYAIGKKWMDVTLKMWIEDIESGLLTKHELYEASRYGEHQFDEKWLHSILDPVVQGTHALLAK